MNFKFLFIVFFSIVSIVCHSQQNKDNYFHFQKMPAEDLENAFSMLNLNVYSIGLSVPEDKKQLVKVYLDEYVQNRLIKSNELWEDVLNYDSAMKFENKFSFYFLKKNDTTTIYSIMSPNGSRTTDKIVMNKKYSVQHGFVPFQAQELVQGKKIPVLLYGSYWHDPNLPKDMLRFCMERSLNSDFSSSAFKEMPHHYIIGIELTDPPPPRKRNNNSSSQSIKIN